MNIKKALNSFLVFISACVTFLYVIYPTMNLVFNGGSFYQSDLGFIRCKDDWSCRHEVAHLMDDELGEPSKSKKFGDALLFYVYYQIKYEDLNDLTKAILGTPGILYYSESYKQFHTESGSSPQQELYANIYVLVDGNIDKLPPTVKQFYTKDSKYDEIYKQLVDKKYYVSNKGVIKMNEKLAMVISKVKENKETVIRVGSVLLGAALGALVATLIVNAQTKYEFSEAEFLGLDEEESEDLETEEETEDLENEED